MIEVIVDSFQNFKGKEISKELSKIIQDYEDLSDYIRRDAISIKLNLESDQGQFKILKGIMTKESPLTEKDIIDANYVIKVLERNINSMEKIEEKRTEIMTAVNKLYALQSNIKEQQEQFNSRIEHCGKHSSTYIAFATVFGALGTILAKFNKNFSASLPPIAGSVLTKVCSSVIGTGIAAVGVAILFGIATYAIIGYINDSSETCKEKLNPTVLNVENLLMDFKKLEKFLNNSNQIKRDIKDYTINQVKDSIENETQRKQNHDIYDKFLKESQELIGLITKFEKTERKT
jgi:fructose-specific phosphotransferase system component IIB